MSTRKFYRTVYTVEVLSEEPISEDMDIAEVIEEASTGEFSMVYTEKHEEIDAQTAAKLLKDQGSDPEFFQLTEDGHEVEGVDDEEDG